MHSICMYLIILILICPISSLHIVMCISFYASSLLHDVHTMHLILCIIVYAYSSYYFIFLQFYILFYTYHLMHISLCILTNVYLKLCIHHPIISTLVYTYNFYHFILCKFAFHFVHIMQVLRFYAPEPMHLIICISSYMHIILRSQQYSSFYMQFGEPPGHLWGVF